MVSRRAVRLKRRGDCGCANRAVVTVSLGVSISGRTSITVIKMRQGGRCQKRGS